MGRPHTPTTAISALLGVGTAAAAAAFAWGALREADGLDASFAAVFTLQAALLFGLSARSRETAAEALDLSLLRAPTAMRGWQGMLVVSAAAVAGSAWQIATISSAAAAVLTALTFALGLLAAASPWLAQRALSQGA